MLDLSKILSDIDGFGRERAQSAEFLRDELSTANGVISEIAEDPASACRRISDAKTSWLTATFEENPSFAVPAPKLDSAHAVVAIDGSQIFADKHEVALCYLINTSAVTLFYGCGERPIALTRPMLFYKNEDLVQSYGGKETRVDQKMVGFRRMVAEFNELERALPTLEKKGVPAVALMDGSMIYWALQGEPEDYRKWALGEVTRALDTARGFGIPVAAYISDPGARDFVNSLRVMLCDQQIIDCDKCTHKKEDTKPPCEKVGRLKDSSVFGSKLDNGCRTVVFSSKSKILDEYGDHRVQSFYLNAGKEIARIEIPAWVSADRSMLDMVHFVCYDQAQKGRGYPVVLAEAHEHAVVRGSERAFFYETVQRAFIKHGAKITMSMKRLSKGY